MRETTNYGLKITEGNDDWRDVFDDNADNMETIDEAMADGAGKAGRELLGYKENGNTASRTIAIGKFVVWKGNLYKAKVAIPQGTAFSTSNLTAVGDGGFNELQTKIGDVGSTDLQSQVTSLNSKITHQVDNIDDFISVFQSDNFVHAVRIASSSDSLPRTLYGTGSSGACVGFRTGDYIIYLAFDSDGLFVTGWVTISQRTATFSRQIKSTYYSGEFSITSADDGLFYTEISRDTLGISNNATLLSAQFASNFSSSETLRISSNSSKVMITATTSRTVTRNLRIFYLE